MLVEFQRHVINTKDIPAHDDFKKILEDCHAFWNKKSDKTGTFIQEAISRLKFSETSVLRVSDFNTTGLAEPFNSRAMQGWNTLTKINGGAIKADTKAGNFGIGKNAPFANSFFRMIFYRTLNTKGERAAQAVAKLVSFDLDAENIAAGTGYYGETRGNLPVENILALEKIFKRIKRGTDVFIYGFNGGEDWDSELVDALIENFLVAIHRDKLRVKVQGFELNKETLGAFVKEDAANYHKILTGDDSIKIFEYPFHDMGKLKLGVLLDPTAKLNRRVLIVRKSGMKLFELDRLPRTLNFTAILELEGFKLNAFFRDMETPDHTNWDPSRHPKFPKLAKKYLAELKSWVRGIISKLAEENFSDEVDVKGLGNILDFDDGAIDDGNKKPVTGGDGDTLTGGEGKSAGGKGGEKKSAGVRCEKIRVIKLDEKIYRLILKSPRKISNGRIEISAVGESNVGEKLFIARATSDDSNSKVFAFGDKIILKNLRGKTDARITFELQENKNYALGVAVHEN